jgi:hypothetical protein
MTTPDTTVQFPDSWLDLRGAATSPSRVVESLIPMVQRSAGPTALLRESRLELGVSETGELVVHFVGGAAR